MDIGRVLARATIGGLFIGHGTQKLFGWFGGPGIDQTTGMMDSSRCGRRARTRWQRGSPRRRVVRCSPRGRSCPSAGALLTGTMATAIRKVHLHKGLWNTGGGYEFNLDPGRGGDRADRRGPRTACPSTRRSDSS